MRTTAKSGGLTVRAIAGTYNVLIGFDLDPAKRANCLGFSIQRTDPQGKTSFLPNRVTFPSTPETTKLDTQNSPLQKFRWGDYTTEPGSKYSYTITARYRDGAGTPVKLKDGDSVTVTVTTEDPKNHATPIFFNRGAAASQAYNDEFGQNDPDDLPEPKKTEALKWLSRGLEEAILDFMAQATDNTFGLHAAVYEFQKPNLLDGLKQALDRKVDVQVVYHFRHKPSPKDKTWKENEEAAATAGLTAVCTQRKQNNTVIMHNKFIVLLKNDAPIAVWTGSTNWTDGGIYGQLNVGHAVYDADVAKTYEAYFQLLKKDLAPGDMKKGVDAISPVPIAPALPGKGVLPVLSPQNDRKMLLLYHAIAQRARCLMVSAPFKLADEITATLDSVPADTMHYLLLDKESSLGGENEIDIIEHNKETGVAFAATLQSVLTSFQDRLLAKNNESFHHQGVHIHSKIIIADPFSDDPILVTGSANFSTNSTTGNDSNTLVVRGDTGVTDIYATEFMRMFEHYHFRGMKKKVADEKATVITLSETDEWSAKYYVAGSNEAADRMLFAGTLPAAPPNPFVAFKAGAKKPASPSKKASSKKKPAAKKAATKKTAKKAAKKAPAKKAATKKAAKKAAKKAPAKKAAKKAPAKKKVTSKKTTTKKKPPAKKAKKAATKKKPPAKKRR